MLRKYFLLAVLAGAALLAPSCDKQFGMSAGTVFVTPTEGKRVPPGAVTIKVKWFTNKCSAEWVSLSADGGLVGSYSSSPLPETCSFTWDASNVTPGTSVTLQATIRYSYRDADKDQWDEKSTSMHVMVDTGGPDINIVSPQDGDTVDKGSVPIRVWARDTSISGIDRVELLVDDLLNGTATDWGEDTWRYTWDASQASAGNHTVKAKAYNGFGEIAAEAISIFVKDTTSGGGPTYHHGYVDTSETWSPSGNPHIVDGNVLFRSSAWLTIKPGCVVKFDSSTTISFGVYGPSGLTAVGTAGNQILFTSNRASPARGDWGGIKLSSQVMPGTRLSYSTIEYGGYDLYNGAAITVGGVSKVDEISNCTIRRSGRFGVFCVDSSGFGAFRNNVVTANLGYGMHVGPRFAELLADGNDFSGNDSSGVELYGRLSVSTTWPDLGLPYIISDVYVYDSTNNPVLTIAPGTEIRFKNLGRLRIGNAGVEIPARIVADGSGGRITFTSTSPSPAPGAFYGVYVYGNSIGESEFRNCDFSYGGQNGDCLLYVKNGSPEIAGCDFGYSAGWGITFRTALVPDTVALKQANSFHDNALGNIKWLLSFPGR
jgi:hypothetical protein